mgnify:CR=1 FL=1
MVLTIVTTAAVTLIAVAVAMNFATPEKKLERNIEHRHAVADPQFRREMGVMLVSDIHRGIGKDLFTVPQFANWANTVSELMFYE